MTTPSVDVPSEIRVGPEREPVGPRHPGPDRSRDRFAEPLDPVGEAAADAVSERVPSPWRAPAAVALAGYVAIAAALIAVGWVLVHTPLGDPVRRWDQMLSRDVSLQRTSGWEDYSSVGTTGADTLPVVAAMVIISGALIALRRWRDLLFVPLALALELSIFLTVNYAVARDRPEVPQLGGEPGTHSFPSGHVAATFVLWFGIAVLVGAGRWRWPWRILAWALAAVPVLTVAFSRVYRGMHFASDVMAGLALGALALGASAVATRSSWLASRRTGEVDR